MLRGCLLWTTICCIAVLWSAGVGCDYSKYERGFPLPDRAFRQADRFDLADASIAPPTTKPAVTTLPTTRSAEELVPPPLAEVRLTLEECRQLALANNLDLKVELFNPSIAREAINQERARIRSQGAGEQYGDTLAILSYRAMLSAAPASPRAEGEKS